MPSPFPGMDPFIEMDVWPDFHLTLMTEMKRQIVPQVAPKYVVRVERQVYLEHFDEDAQEDDEEGRTRRAPDLAISLPASHEASRAMASTGAVAEHRIYTIPLPQEQKHTSLAIRTNDEGHELVTLIEVLSPTNKRPGTDGFRRYLEKREELLAVERVNLIEIDLLCGGTRPKTKPALQASTDYCALVHPVSIRPRAKVFEWTLRDSMPAIPLPLAHDGADGRIDLQAAFQAMYDASGYDYSLPYKAQLKPKLRAADVEWVTQRLAARRLEK